MSQKPNFNGTWNGTLISCSGNEHEFKVTLKESRGKITGDLLLIKKAKVAKKIEHKTFVVQGVVHDGCMALTARNSVTDAAGVHVYLLRIVTDKLLQGMILSHSVTNRIIEDGEIEWRKL